MRARAAVRFRKLRDDLHKVLPILNAEGSDSSILDNAFEFFVMAGKPAHTAMMLIPNHGQKTLTCLKRNGLL